ncbi:hypothetical protein [Sphingomonas vulcanisoli]|uniref:hypothetical protein n=1 Tax=Sphingomonas vulcanisoli TaxID=1658060 RepID=UPI00142408DD|nr:hypothetical protein [Sphingomonas vulcanisoli]
MSDVPANVPAPIAVGVTGHRAERLGTIDQSVLAAQVDGVLVAIERAAHGACFRLVGSLAEGADTIMADVALARGWQVDTVLPFAREIYERDFDQAEAAKLHRLLAVSTDVFELPGARDESGGSSSAYERAGRIVLAQSDLLLAIWDGEPVRGRGGTAQIIEEAIATSIPVLVLDPESPRPPQLLWRGLNAHELGPESVETVARGTVQDLPRLFSTIMLAEAPPPDHSRRGWLEAGRRAYALAYPLLLAAAGVRRPRAADFRKPKPPPRPASIADPGSIDARINHTLLPYFDEADCAATHAAQQFRGAFVSNFALAALAVILSLLGLLIPVHLKPLLVLGEFTAIASILTITHTASRAGWHQLWLDRRQLAEQLRCLALSARLGDLLLHGVAGESARAGTIMIARRLGLPSARVDTAYLAATYARFIDLLDDQMAYLGREAARMHRLEHRLHRLGAVLFAVTALLCIAVLLIEGLGALLPDRMAGLAHRLPLGVTVISAALPAIGAAIYGIRMQGDFAGVVERNEILAERLAQVRRIAIDEAASFDGLRRLVARTAELLTADVSQWLRASKARPLALPG